MSRKPSTDRTRIAIDAAATDKAHLVLVHPVSALVTLKVIIVFLVLVILGGELFGSFGEIDNLATGPAADDVVEVNLFQAVVFFLFGYTGKLLDMSVYKLGSM